jgi:hypothetical protein
MNKTKQNKEPKRNREGSLGADPQHMQFARDRGQRKCYCPCMTPLVPAEIFKTSSREEWHWEMN